MKSDVVGLLIELTLAECHDIELFDLVYKLLISYKQCRQGGSPAVVIFRSFKEK